jgi:multisubunit Na+/H+ antiporter MnhB subunit
MVYLVLVIIAVSIRDIWDLASRKKKKDMIVYIAIMLLVTALGIFYFSNPERDSLSKIILSFVGKGD